LAIIACVLARARRFLWANSRLQHPTEHFSRFFDLPTEQGYRILSGRRNPGNWSHHHPYSDLGKGGIADAAIRARVKWRVGVLSFARYAVESVLRSRRRSIQAMAGVAIAISLFSGSVIAIDSSVSSIVSDAISSIVVDFSGECGISAYPVDPSRHLSALEDFRSVEEVEYATTSVALHSWTYVNDTGKSYSDPLPWMTYGTIILL
jgi:hypothetical protein